MGVQGAVLVVRVLMLLHLLVELLLLVLLLHEGGVLLHGHAMHLALAAGVGEGVATRHGKLGGPLGLLMERVLAQGDFWGEGLVVVEVGLEELLEEGATVPIGEGGVSLLLLVVEWLVMANEDGAVVVGGEEDGDGVVYVVLILGGEVHVCGGGCAWVGRVV